jgi:hypothetical protein
MFPYSLISIRSIHDSPMAGKPVIGLRTATLAFNGLKGEQK